mgnify:FL=1
MAYEKQCEEFTCKKAGIGLLSVAPGTSLWLCQYHMIEMVKKVQEEGKVNE